MTDPPSAATPRRWEPDGSLLVISQSSQELLRIPAGEAEPVVASDLSGVGIYPNDMAVDHEGRAYASHFGFDWFSGAEPQATGLIVRHPDGRTEQQGAGLQFPNGVVISGDRRTLYVAESFATPLTRLTAFDIGDDGALSGQRVVREFGSFESHIVDGICIDVEDGVWVSVCQQGEYWRVLPDGTVTDTVSIPAEGGNYVVDSALGGPDGTTLFMLIADADVERIAAGFQTTARIEAVGVSVPGVPLP